MRRLMQIRLRTKRKAELIAAKGWACERCGEDRLAALTLHHPPDNPRSSKQQLWHRPWTVETWQEAMNCELLCANCHQIHHAGDDTATSVLVEAGLYNEVVQRNSEARNRRT